jgi:hypothetical protein
MSTDGKAEPPRRANERAAVALPPFENCRSRPNRHSEAMQSIEPGISGFPDAQLRICGLVLRTIPE